MLKYKTYPNLLPKSSSKLSLKIFIIVLSLAIFGCIMVYSASSYSALNNYNNEYHFLIKQIIGVVLGIIALIITYKIDYHIYYKFKWVACIISFVFLILVFVPGIGVSNYGANRWIGLPGFTIQGSEIAKFGFIIFCVCVLCGKKFEALKFKSYLPILIVGVLMCILIMLEPNMSITMCVGIVMLIMLFVGGMKLKQLTMLAVPAVAVVPLLIILEPYRLKRLFAFIDPWASPQGEGFQLIQSLYSLGSGGWFGVGLFNSRQKYQFLPFSESDFIFSIIGEEFGFIGCLLLILVFIALIYLIIKVALRAKDRFGCLLSVGVASVIGVQILINLAVVTGSIPPTGVPLPFISAGSTSLVVFMSAIGVILNVDRQSRKSKI
ncbi:MAG: putative lipid II flippase FtsW [Clostridia bacterium]|nr:putative lipid II flippase FtsW [Clostridia bacterium]